MGETEQPDQNKSDMSGEGMSQDALDKTLNKQYSNASTNSSNRNNWFKDVWMIIQVIFWPFIVLFWDLTGKPILGWINRKSISNVKFEEVSPPNVEQNTQNPTTIIPQQDPTTIIPQQDPTDVSQLSPDLTDVSQPSSNPTIVPQTLPNNVPLWNDSCNPGYAAEAEANQTSIWNQQGAPIVSSVA